MNKGKTLLDFFTRSPASNSSPNGSLSKSETGKTLDKNGTPKSSKNLSTKTPNKSGKLSSGLAFSNKNSKTPTSTPKSGSATKRSPGGKRKPSEDQENIENESTENKNCSGSDLSEDENEAQPSKSKTAKRRRIVVASESEDSDEYVPDKHSESSDSEPEPDNSSESDAETPKKKRKTSQTSTPSLQAFSSKKKSTGNSSIIEASPKSASFNAASSPITIPKLKSSEITDEKGSNLDSVVKEYIHEKIDWLQPNKIRDKSGKLASDPKYNPTTLFVPENFLNKTTPAMRQWWELKAEHFDTVLFFKVGRFYELYHMDATIGVKELGLIYMKGDFAHSGFPESAFGKYSESLIEKGYKVARVEQTESPEEMALRCKKMSRPSKFDKVVSREICQITTKGTRTLTYQEENMSVTNNFLLAICEKSVNDADSLTEYGICFVDTSVGKFWLGQFKDDRYRSRLLTLIALHPIVEVLYDKLYIRKQTLRLLDNNLCGVRKEALNSSTQFWEPSKVLQFLRKSGYYNNSEGELEFPQSLMKMLDSDDLLLQTPLKQYEFALRSLGACVWYLKECHIEDCLLSMKLFEEYIPSDGAQCGLSKFSDSQKNMVLDSVTLKNLEIVPVSSDNNEGTLLGTMDNCSTSFGKRLFRSWLCSPLYNPKDISERLDAIEDLMELPDLVQSSTSLLTSLPDLERLLSKIHTFGFARSKSHPDSRATFYNSELYNKRKIIDFLSTLQGFKTVVEIVSLFKQHSDAFKSPLLKYCTSFASDSGHFPHVLEQLEYFDKAFDHEMAKSKGCIIPGAGIDAEYDNANSDMEKALKNLELFLTKQKKSLGCKASYVHSGKNRYLLEVPDTIKVPSGFDYQGGRKGFKRFYTEEIKELLADLIKSEESRNAALEDISRRIFAKFDSDYEKWKTALQCISTLDALISLTRYSQSSSDMCRPTFKVPSENEQPFVSISDGRHPTFLTYTNGDDYIPNSVYIGPKKETETDQINQGGTIVLVTGPNMGGKSTLMRQAGTLVIMAHLGSYVPASSMSLTPVDRIFTRVGAMDHLSKGESTFFVEASETSGILHHATSNSFVLVDELGRGTATYDGTAIANATLKYLANNIKCRTLFSTHYHSLVNDFSDHPNVGLGHMACMEESDEECSSLEKITFLYKFINGACPKSYGFNCALLAGVPKPVVEFGFFKAQQVECKTKILRSLRKLFASHSPGEVINVLATKLNFLDFEEAKN